MSCFNFTFLVIIIFNLIAIILSNAEEISVLITSLHHPILKDYAGKTGTYQKEKNRFYIGESKQLLEINDELSTDDMALIPKKVVKTNDNFEYNPNVSPFIHPNICGQQNMINKYDINQGHGYIATSDIKIGEIVYYECGALMNPCTYMDCTIPQYYKYWILFLHKVTPIEYIDVIASGDPDIGKDVWIELKQLVITGQIEAPFDEEFIGTFHDGALSSFYYNDDLIESEKYLNRISDVKALLRAGIINHKQANGIKHFLILMHGTPFQLLTEIELPISGGINHEFHANIAEHTIEVAYGSTCRYGIASRNIMAGQEITKDYTEQDMLALIQRSTARHIKDTFIAEGLEADIIQAVSEIDAYNGFQMKRWYGVDKLRDIPYYGGLTFGEVSNEFAGTLAKLLFSNADGLEPEYAIMSIFTDIMTPILDNEQQYQLGFVMDPCLMGIIIGLESIAPETDWNIPWITKYTDSIILKIFGVQEDDFPEECGDINYWLSMVKSIITRGPDELTKYIYSTNYYNKDITDKSWSYYFGSSFQKVWI